jgi:hypothetical protein
MPQPKRQGRGRRSIKDQAGATGVIKDSETLTVTAGARRLGIAERTFREQFVYGGMEVFSVGRITYFSGRNYRRFIERNSTCQPASDDSVRAESA